MGFWRQYLVDNGEAIVVFVAMIISIVIFSMLGCSLFGYSGTIVLVFAMIGMGVWALLLYFVIEYLSYKEEKVIIEQSGDKK